MKAIHWLITLDGVKTAKCSEYKELVEEDTDFDDLIAKITELSKAKLGTCKILITIGIDVK